MTGIILLIIIGIWLYIVKHLVGFIMIRLPEARWKQALAMCFFAIIFSLPVVDEIIGSMEFQQLCDQRAVLIKLNRENIRGRFVYYDYVYPTKIIRGQVTNETLIANNFLPIWERSVRYLNADNAEVISYKELHAEGGWIARFVNFNSTHTPYIFDGSCRPKENIKDLFKSLNITAIDRISEKYSKESK